MTCSRCHREHDRAGQRLCHDCHAANMRVWRAGQAEERKKTKAAISKMQTIMVELR